MKILQYLGFIIITVCFIFFIGVINFLNGSILYNSLENWELILTLSITISIAIYILALFFIIYNQKFLIDGIFLIFAILGSIIVYLWSGEWNNLTLFLGIMLFLITLVSIPIIHTI